MGGRCYRAGNHIMLEGDDLLQDLSMPRQGRSPPFPVAVGEYLHHHLHHVHDDIVLVRAALREARSMATTTSRKSDGHLERVITRKIQKSDPEMSTMTEYPYSTTLEIHEPADQPRTPTAMTDDDDGNDDDAQSFHHGVDHDDGVQDQAIPTAETMPSEETKLEPSLDHKIVASVDDAQQQDVASDSHTEDAISMIVHVDDDDDDDGETETGRGKKKRRLRH